MKRCPFCAEEIQDEARVCRWCGRDLPDPWAIPTTEAEPAAVMLYRGRRYAFGLSRQPPATCMWDLKDPSAPPIRTWPVGDQGWTDGWKAFIRKEKTWYDLRNPPRCLACGSTEVVLLGKWDTTNFECKVCHHGW